jgi:hypothetical protein
MQGVKFSNHLPILLKLEIRGLYITNNGTALKKIYHKFKSWKTYSFNLTYDRTNHAHKREEICIKVTSWLILLIVILLKLQLHISSS